MPEKLSKIHRDEVTELQKKLRPVKCLYSGVNTIHGIHPTENEVTQYKVALDELGRSMGNLPNAIYNVWLESKGNYHNLKVGITNMDTDVSDIKLEGAIDKIYSSIERTKWRSRDPGVEHTETDVKETVKKLRENGGDIEYFDRIPFFLYSR